MGCDHDKVIARVHLVHLVSVEHHQLATEPQIKPSVLGHELCCRLLLYTPTFTINYYYFSA